QRRIANEVQGVAQALLGVQQNGLSVQRRPIPERLAEAVPRSPLALPTPFILRPPLFEVARQQPDHRAIPMGPGKVRLIAQGLLMAGECLGELPLLLENISRVG